MTGERINHAFTVKPQRTRNSGAVSKKFWVPQQGPGAGATVRLWGGGFSNSNKVLQSSEVFEAVERKFG